MVKEKFVINVANVDNVINTFVNCMCYSCTYCKYKQASTEEEFESKVVLDLKMGHSLPLKPKQ